MLSLHVFDMLMVGEKNTFLMENCYMMAFCFKSFCVLMLFDAVPAALRSVRCACLICVHVSGGGNVSAGEWEAAEKTPFLLVSVTFKVRNGRGGMIYTKVYVGVCVCVSRIVKRHTHRHTHTEACCVWRSKNERLVS